VQLPKVFGGAEGEALFVDTNGDFSFERANEMGKSFRNMVMQKIQHDPGLIKKYKDQFTVNQILERIHYTRIFDEPQQNVLNNCFE